MSLKPANHARNHVTEATTAIYTYHMAAVFIYRCRRILSVLNGFNFANISHAVHLYPELLPSERGGPYKILKNSAPPFSHLTVSRFLYTIITGRRYSPYSEGKEGIFETNIMHNPRGNHTKYGPLKYIPCGNIRA